MDAETTALLTALKRGLIKDEQAGFCIVRDAIRETVADTQRLNEELAVSLEKAESVLAWVEAEIARLDQKDSDSLNMYTRTVRRPPMAEFALPRYIELPKVRQVGDIVQAMKEMSEQLEAEARSVALQKAFDPTHQNYGKLEFVNAEWYAVAADVLRQVVEWAEGHPAVPACPPEPRA